MRSIVKIMALVVGAIMGALVLAGSASATHVVAEVSVPDEVEAGESAELTATLRFADGSQAVPDTPVTFFTNASFGGVEGEVELGSAMTDESGVAVLNYEPRTAGNHEIRVEYKVPGESEPEVVTTSISVVGGTQLHRSTSGVDIPGLNVWLLIALVGGVWVILLTVAARVIAIAHAGGESNGPSGGRLA